MRHVVEWGECGHFHFPDCPHYIKPQDLQDIRDMIEGFDGIYNQIKMATTKE